MLETIFNFSLFTKSLKDFMIQKKACTVYTWRRHRLCITLTLLVTLDRTLHVNIMYFKKHNKKKTLTPLVYVELLYSEPMRALIAFVSNKISRVL